METVGFIVVMGVGSIIASYYCGLAAITIHKSFMEDGGRYARLVKHVSLKIKGKKVY